jgi:hypothetical protein
MEKSDHRNWRLLRVRDKRPGSRSAAEQRYELTTSQVKHRISLPQDVAVDHAIGRMNIAGGGLPHP